MAAGIRGIFRDDPGFDGLGIHFSIAYCGLGFRGGDFRAPAAIRAWAASIRPLPIQEQERGECF